MDFGWFIRGLHHFGSQTMVVLLGVHMLQVVIAGAELPPREVNWWLGLCLLATVLGLSLTGYLLPWDQKGYWATQVATNIAGGMPVLGSWVKKVIVGGPEYGHQTLTHFYALHVGILPALTVLLIVAHVAIFRRHGVTHPANAQGEGWFWPEQAFKDMVASMLIFAVMIGLVLWGQGHPLESQPVHGGFYEQWAHAGQFGRGANLDAPADPSRPYPARPEWYFLFLFQTLKYFQGPFILVGTLVIPMLAGLALFVLPLLGRGKWRPFGYVTGIVVVVSLLGGAAFLTYQALAEDAANTEFKEEVAKAEVLADRAVNLAAAGIPQEGGTYLLRRDPKTQGPKLFKESCGSCHSYTGPSVPDAVAVKPLQLTAESLRSFREQHSMPDAVAEKLKPLTQGKKPDQPPPALTREEFIDKLTELLAKEERDRYQEPLLKHADTKKAGNLAGWGTKDWVLRLLTNPAHPDFFGRTGRKEMAEAIQGNFPNVALPREEQAKLAGDDKATLEQDKKDLEALAVWLASHPSNSSPDRKEEWFTKGVQLFKDRSCNTCHVYEGKGGKKGPELTGYGSAEWLRVMIMAPNDRSRYFTGNRMPAFRDLEGVTADLTKLEWDRSKNRLLDEINKEDPKAEQKKKDIEAAYNLANLNDVNRELILRWLVGDDRVVFGGQPISGPPKRE
jgi:quinol-cytochrome oxidoreductase complex cytochrome b subunit/mono/diheme cytochrome c family protein